MSLKIFKKGLGVTYNKYVIKTSSVIHNFPYQYSTSHSISQLGKSKSIGPLGWCLLIIPASTFALGTWQTQRKKWKESLIIDLKKRTNTNPIPLPHSLKEIENLEYYPAHVKGCFLHDEEIYIGPRSLIEHGDAVTNSALITHGQSQSNGLLVITPFKTTDGRKILINRGWVSNKFKNPKARQNGQVEGEVDVVGLIRLHENRPVFMPSNKLQANYWTFRDLKQMASIKGTEPILLDATDDFKIDGGPVPGQTRISLRNEHLSYILTWYSLCAATSFMWYNKFLRKA